MEYSQYSRSTSGTARSVPTGLRVLKARSTCSTRSTRGVPRVLHVLFLRDCGYLRVLLTYLGDRGVSQYQLSTNSLESHAEYSEYPEGLGSHTLTTIRTMHSSERVPSQHELDSPCGDRDS